MKEKKSKEDAVAGVYKVNYDHKDMSEIDLGDSYMEKPSSNGAAAATYNGDAVSPSKTDKTP